MPLQVGPNDYEDQKKVLEFTLKTTQHSTIISKALITPYSFSPS